MLFKILGLGWLAITVISLVIIFLAMNGVAVTIIPKFSANLLYFVFGIGYILALSYYLFIKPLQEEFIHVPRLIKWYLFNIFITLPILGIPGWFLLVLAYTL